jgi:hypothetical protein
MKIPKMPAFLIDESALRSMFEGKGKGTELLKKLNDLSLEGKPVKAVTPLASFLRAIYLMEPDTKIQSIQKVLNFIEILHSNVDFRDENEVIKEIIKYAHLMQGRVDGNKSGN